jgi:proline dehydrogenase
MLRKSLLYLSEQKNLQNWLLQFGATRAMASRFVAGDTLGQAVTVTRDLNAKGVSVTLDHLGEHVRDPAAAAAARDAYIATLTAIQQSGVHSGISIKLTQLGLDFSEGQCRDNLRAVLEHALNVGRFVRVDMESSAYTERTLALVKEMRRRFENIGTVIQAYLYRSEEDVRALIESGVSIRLCKGAYNEPASVAFPRKSDVDRNYVRLMQVLLASGLYHAIATHDPKMIDATRLFAAERGLGSAAFEFQMLYGIRNDLRQRLVREGRRLRIYVPFGSEWFSYFMRRLAERPANLLFVLKSVTR